MNRYLPNQITAIHEALANAAISHAFGGAIALAYYGHPRATYDINVNIFLPVEATQRILSVLSALFDIPNRDQAQAQLLRAAQARLRWGVIPVNVFLANLPFHNAMATRVRFVDFAGVSIPILSAEDLIICKAAFDRPKDWIDIEDVFEVQRQNLDER